MIGSKLRSEIIRAHDSNYTKTNGRIVREITIHHMAGKLTARACGSIFQNPNRNASSHYGIGYDGEIAQYVSERDIAWTNSNWESNSRAVTIETSNSSYGGNWHVTDASLNSLIKLIRDIAERNNLLPLVKGKNLTWHNMYIATSCPGDYLLSKMDYIIEQVNKGIEISSQPSNTKPQAKSISQLADEVMQGMHGNGQDRIRSLGANYEAVQREVNRRYGIGTSTPQKSVKQLADEVIQGLHGNGEERKRRLGANYNAVQREVNRRYGI